MFSLNDNTKDTKDEVEPSNDGYLKTWEKDSQWKVFYWMWKYLTVIW